MVQRPIKIVITDNVKRFRDLLKAELKSFTFVDCIGEANNGRELLHMLTSQKPDVVLLDLEMPVMDGSETMDHIATRFPETKVIVISSSYEQLLVEDFIQRGAKGYIPKDEILGNFNLLAEGIRMVSNGETFIHHLPTEKQTKSLKYSQKDKVIIPMMCQGFTNEDIAQEIGVGVRNVEKHRKRIYSKLGGDKAIVFFQYAFSKGLHFLGKIKRKQV